MIGRLFRFGLVGGSGVLVNLVIFRACLLVIPAAPGLANALAVEGSIITNYFLNARFTFFQPPRWHELGKYNLASLVGALIQVAIFNLLLSQHVNRLLADLVAIPFGTIFTFSLSNSWVFRHLPVGSNSKEGDVRGANRDGDYPAPSKPRDSRSSS